MRRLLLVLACGFAGAPLGCGNAPSTPKVDRALEEQQNKSQKQADAEEREMQKQQNRKP